MTYNPSTPNALDLPSDCQDEFLTNFDLLNSIYSFDHFQFGNRIQQATTANPCLITSVEHGLTTGDQVIVDNLVGLETNEFGNYLPWSINGNTYAVTVIDADTFTIPVDTSSFDEYIPNSGDFTIFSLISGLPVPYGYHKKISLANALPEGPFRLSPITTIFTKMQEVFKIVRNPDLPPGVDPQILPVTEPIDIAQLRFQNGNAPANEFPLMQASFTQQTYYEQPAETPPKGYRGTAFGFKTGFGLTVNFGRVSSNSAAAILYNLPIAYTTTHYTTVATNNGPVANTVDPRITATTLSSFSIQSPGGTTNQLNYFLSIGR